MVFLEGVAVSHERGTPVQGRNLSSQVGSLGGLSLLVLPAFDFTGFTLRNYGSAEHKGNALDDVEDFPLKMAQDQARMWELRIQGSGFGGDRF